MGGQEGNRGYLLQAIIAVLQSLTENDWVSISIEPNENNQKVDIQQWDSKGNETVTQVKSSINNFDKAEIFKIIADLINDAPDAKQFIFTLIGTFSSGTVKFFHHLDEHRLSDFGNYPSIFKHRNKIVTDLKALDLAALDGLMESKIHAFLSAKNYIVHHHVINLISLGLQAQFSRFATNGTKVSRTELEEQIISWMKFNYPKELRRENEKLALAWYHENTIHSDNWNCPVLRLSSNILINEIKEQEDEIKTLIDKIKLIQLPPTQPENVNTNNRFNIESIFGPYDRPLYSGANCWL